MNQTDKCATCNFFMPAPDEMKEPGMCRRYPPVVMQKAEDTMFSTFPRVNPGMLCGEHQLSKVL